MLKSIWRKVSVFVEQKQTDFEHKTGGLCTHATLAPMYRRPQQRAGLCTGSKVRALFTSYKFARSVNLAFCSFRNSLIYKHSLSGEKRRFCLRKTGSLCTTAALISPCTLSASPRLCAPAQKVRALCTSYKFARSVNLAVSLD